MSERLISLAPSITETIFALGHNDKLVGITDYCTFPKGTDSIDKIGGFIAPDLDRIMALKPDLVICTTLHKMEKLQPLLDSGVEVKQVTALKLFDAPSMIREVGEAIGCYEEAGELAKKIQAGFDEVFEMVKNNSIKRVCYLCTSNPFCNWKSKCQTNELVVQLGGKLTAYDKNDLAKSIVDSDPEIIIIPYSKDKDDYKIQAKFVDDNPIFRETTAFKTGRMQNINGELLSRPGPRAAEGLRQLFDLIHN